MKEEQITQEIINCFKYQYPDKHKQFSDLLCGKYRYNVEQAVDIYEDTLYTINFLINLIRRRKNAESR